MTNLFKLMGILDPLIALSVRKKLLCNLGLKLLKKNNLFFANLVKVMSNQILSFSAKLCLKSSTWLPK